MVSNVHPGLMSTPKTAVKKWKATIYVPWFVTIWRVPPNKPWLVILVSNGEQWGIMVMKVKVNDYQCL
jgi:hypothetical protein